MPEANSNPTPPPEQRPEVTEKTLRQDPPTGEGTPQSLQPAPVKVESPPKQRPIGQSEHGTQVVCLDEPGPGGACHLYHIHVKASGDVQRIQFQKGPLQEAGPNGIFMEDLLVIVKDRLQGFQSGNFACPENSNALAHVEAALRAMNQRTAKRQAAGTEGTSQK